MRYRLHIFFLSLLFFTSTIANAADLPSLKMRFTLKSTAFDNQQLIPQKYTCKDANISPPLNWFYAPRNTKSYALIVDDPDAPSGIWTHWIVFNIPFTLEKLPENFVLATQGMQFGTNSWGKVGYNGPCPPAGVHRYQFKLYALDTKLNLINSASKMQVDAAMQGHVLATTELIGLYQN
jgi:Raf kinase inhibitor-like YbhB/YbcL family protein